MPANPFRSPRSPLRRRPPARAYRPAVELLEARQLLSTSVLTYHNDNARTGQNLTETTLTPSNVYAGNFGKLFSYPVDGQVYAQPLYLPGVPLADGPHDVVFVATEHDSLYAFDANDPTAGPSGNGILWQDSFVDASQGTFPFNQSDALGCSQITPEIGITATPVIDPVYDDGGNLVGGTLYVVDQFKDTNGATTYHQQLHAIDITTGSDLVAPVEIEATVINDLGQPVTFNPRYYKERAALTLSNGVLYTAWASHCDITPSHGWVIGYDASSLQQVSVFNTSPNGNLDTIWQGDGGLAVDPGGNLYFETGNGTDITGHGDDYSEAFLRLNGGDGQTVDDYFIPSNYHELDQADRDLGSGAPIVLPDQPGDHPHLLVGAGKEGKIYLIDRDNMGGLNNPPNGPDLVVQEVPGAITGGSWDTPAYFDAGDPNGPFIYYAGNGDFVKAFQLTNGLFNPNPTSQSPTHISGSYGGTPVVSANGTADGIVWVLQNASPAVLHAYDATDLSNELYNTSQVPGDQPGAGVKFNSPIVADGKVFVPGSNYLAVYGLLGPSPGVSAKLGRSVALATAAGLSHSSGDAAAAGSVGASVAPVHATDTQAAASAAIPLDATGGLSSGAAATSGATSVTGDSSPVGPSAVFTDPLDLSQPLA